MLPKIAASAITIGPTGDGEEIRKGMPFFKFNHSQNANK
jgi:hypothetical protein